MLSQDNIYERLYSETLVVKSDKAPQYFKSSYRKRLRWQLNKITYSGGKSVVKVQVSGNKLSIPIMLPKTILLLLLLGAIAQLSISEHRNRSNSIVPPANSRKDSSSFVLVNPNQVPRLERTIRRFLSKMAEPVKRPIILRSTSPTKNDLQLTIREICSSMRKTLMQLARDCELTTTVRRYEQDLNSVPVSEDWFSEALLQGAYMFRDLSNMINEIMDEIQPHFDQRNVSSQRSKQVTRQADGLQFLGVIYNAADFGERLSQCLAQMADRSKYKASFDLNRAILNLTKYPPNVALKIFRSNIVSAPLNASAKHRGAHKTWHVFLCLSMIKEEGIRYDDCIRDLKHLDTCLRSLKQRSASKKKDSEVQPWMKAIQRLSDCKIQEDKQGKVRVSCKGGRETQRNVKQKMRYVFERILGKQLSKRSPLHRAAGDLGDALSRSNWGQKFVDEVCQYLAIYENGSRNLQRLSTYAVNDRRAMARYKETSRALGAYKRGIFLRTFGAMNKIHRSSVDFEKFLVDGIKMTLNETWQSHVRIFSCMMDWMMKLLELHVGAESSGDGHHSTDTNTELAESAASENSIDAEDYGSDLSQTARSHSKAEIMKQADAKMNNLMESMNRVTRYQSAKDESMLGCLANNLLLVAMFVETLGFVSTLFCFRQPVKQQQNLVDFERKGNRIHRSLFPLDDQEDVDSILQDYLYLGVYENFTTLIRDESD